jgi:NAD+ kinase
VVSIASMSAESRPPARPLAAIGFVGHGGRAPARDAAVAASARFADTGVKVVACSDDGWNAEGIDVRPPEAFAAGLELVLVFGGDGTFLRAAHLVRDARVPLLGVNLGRLGFFSELEATDVATAVPRLAAGDVRVEERMTLAVEVCDAAGGVVGASWALNEASVERQMPQRLVVLEVHIGPSLFARVPADALILATPTGSTAYAFSAGGPILSPRLEAILLTPVASHSLFNRTVVVDPAESLSVRPAASERACLVSLDGRESIAVPDGGWVRVRRGDTPVRLARLEPFDFYERVSRKFNLDR